jgi:hypothetical protein
MPLSVIHSDMTEMKMKKASSHRLARWISLNRFVVIANIGEPP